MTSAAIDPSETTIPEKDLTPPDSEQERPNDTLHEEKEALEVKRESFDTPELGDNEESSANCDMKDEEGSGKEKSNR